MRSWAVPGVDREAGALCAGAQAIRLADGRAHGWELLARRIDYPASEGAGPALALIRDATDWFCLDTFMLQQATSLAISTTREQFFVNLSPTTARDPKMLDRYLDAATAAAAAAGYDRIGIEVHEEINWSRREFNHFIDDLHARGLLAVMDDFRGTRTCWEKSCARWDVIKLDCASMPVAKALAAIDVLKDGNNVPAPAMLVAEAVETIPDRDALVRAGAQALQGFINGPVVSADSLAHPGRSV